MNNKNKLEKYIAFEFLIEKDDQPRGHFIGRCSNRMENCLRNDNSVYLIL